VGCLLQCRGSFLVLFEPGTQSDLPGRSRVLLREVFVFFKDRAGPKKTEGGIREMRNEVFILSEVLEKRDRDFIIHNPDFFEEPLCEEVEGYVVLLNEKYWEIRGTDDVEDFQTRLKLWFEGDDFLKENITKIMYSRDRNLGFEVQNPGGKKYTIWYAPDEFYRIPAKAIESAVRLSPYVFIEFLFDVKAKGLVDKELFEIEFFEKYDIDQRVVKGYLKFSVQSFNLEVVYLLNNRDNLLRLEALEVLFPGILDFFKDSAPLSYLLLFGGEIDELSVENFVRIAHKLSHFLTEKGSRAMRRKFEERLIEALRFYSSEIKEHGYPKFWNIRIGAYKKGWPVNCYWAHPKKAKHELGESSRRRPIPGLGC